MAWNLGLDGLVVTSRLIKGQRKEVMKGLSCFAWLPDRKDPCSMSNAEDA